MTIGVNGYSPVVTDTLHTQPTDAAESAASAAPARQQRPWWRTPPVDLRGLVLWVATFVVMTALVAGLGLLVVHELGGVRSFDDRVARWFARHRTHTWDDITEGGSFIADAYVKIPAAVLLCALFTWLWRRWTEPALLAGALALEVSIFSLAAFPSGHSAAAVAFYGAIAIIVCWHTRNRVARAVFVTIAVLVPLIVGTSRMYRGMHHLSDVVVGLVIGLVSLWVTWLVVRSGPASRLEPGRRARHPDTRQTGADAPVSSSTP
jgi:membrane-associated phospholipid phosphatase